MSAAPVIVGIDLLPGAGLTRSVEWCDVMAAGRPEGVRAATPVGRRCVVLGTHADVSPGVGADSGLPDANGLVVGFDHLTIPDVHGDVARRVLSWL
jgi:hypothetical protein